MLHPSSELKCIGSGEHSFTQASYTTFHRIKLFLLKTSDPWKGPSILTISFNTCDDRPEYYDRKGVVDHWQFQH
jgi:hypothetical protein